MPNGTVAAFFYQKNFNDFIIILEFQIGNQKGKVLYLSDSRRLVIEAMKEVNKYGIIDPREVITNVFESIPIKGIENLK